ncbi:MAG: hypothetical protein L6Q35_04860 [Phycisphaerales bacterium]|nr:hypothetical protein [Phycisphaerales bacterium]
MMRRGFTILELSLAASIGGLIVLASLGVFTALDRTDQTLKSRFDQTSQLTRLHAVMRRTFVNLAMSSKPKPVPRQQANAQANQANRATGRQTDTGSNDGQNAGDPNNPPVPQVTQPARVEPARVILGEDRRLSLTPMVRMASPAELGRGELSAPAQRLEVVVGRPPVPLPRTRDSSVFPEGNAGQDEMSDGDPIGTKLFRGIFELQPVPAGTVGPGGSAPRPILTWVLWWRPLPPGSEAEQSPEGSVREYDLLPPTLIATDLTFLRWQFYDDRQRKVEFSTAYTTDLPAYVEMEVQTAAGLWANWLFEIDFMTSNEETEDEPAGGQGGTTPRPAGSRTDAGRLDRWGEAA